MELGRFQAPGQPELHSEFRASLSYVVRDFVSVPSSYVPLPSKTGL